MFGRDSKKYGKEGRKSGITVSLLWMLDFEVVEILII